MNKRNVKLLLEYDGTNYSGWAPQEGRDTIAGRIIDAIEKMTGERPFLAVAGRTDAGVHALAQVANFRTRSDIEAKRFAPGLNSHLPNDISVHQSVEMVHGFDARRNALSKRYRYRFYIGPQPAALEVNRSWLQHAALDVDAMRTAAAHLLGELDFESFRSAQCDAEHARRTMFALDVQRTPRPPLGEYVELTFHANAYCRNMCRIIAGTLAEVGEGKRTPDNIAEVLGGRDRKLAGMTAPAHGLTLVEVLYP